MTYDQAQTLQDVFAEYYGINLIITLHKKGDGYVLTSEDDDTCVSNYDFMMAILNGEKTND